MLKDEGLLPSPAGLILPNTVDDMAKMYKSGVNVEDIAVRFSMGISEVKALLKNKGIIIEAKKPTKEIVAE